MRKTWYYRLLLSYLPVFFAVTFILLFLYFASLSDRNEKQIKEARKSIGLEVMQLVDSNLQMINTMFLRETLNNKEIKAFLSDAQNDFNKYKAYEQIQEFMAANRLIESIYLINFKDGLVLGNSRPYTLEEFEQFSFLEQRSLEGNPYRWSQVHTPNRTSSELAEDPASAHIISLFRKVGNSERDGLIVVNVNIAGLREMISRAYDPDLVQVRIMGDDNAVVLDNRAAEWGRPAESDRSDSNQIAILKSSVTGWTFYIGQDHSWLFRSSSIVSNLGLLLAVLAVLAGALVIVLLTRKNYKPIEQYRSQILSEQELRNHYEIREMLEGNRGYHAAAWQEMRKRNGIPDERCARQVLMVEIDDGRSFNRMYSSKDQELLRFVLFNVAGEMARERVRAAYCNWLTEARLLVIVYRSLPAAGSERFADELADDIIAWVKRNLRFTITIGIGTPIVEEEQISVSYQEAKLALSRKITLGKNRSLAYADMSPSMMRELDDPMSHIAQIVKALMQGKSEWEGQLQNLIAVMKLQSLSRSDSLNLLQYMVYQLQKELSRQQESIAQYWNVELLPQLEEILHTDETLDEISEHLHKAFQPLCTAIADQQRSTKHYELMQQVKAYLELNYSDDAISLESLSCKFGIGDKYLSKLFKDTNGIHFGEFLTQLRLEKAKQLLVETTDSVQVIGRKVGYVNPLTFTRVFKRTYGITPSELRQKDSRGA